MKAAALGLLAATVLLSSCRAPSRPAAPRQHRAEPYFNDSGWQASSR